LLSQRCPLLVIALLSTNMSSLSYMLAGLSLSIPLGSGQMHASEWVRPSLADVSTKCFTHGTTLPPMVDGNEETRWGCCYADIGLSSADVKIEVPGSKIAALKAKFHCTTSWTLTCATTGAVLTSGSGPDTGYVGGCNNGWVETEFPSANCGSVLLSMTKSQYGTCHGIYELQYQATSVSWMVAPQDCQTCDEVCTGHSQVCDVSLLGPILTESEVTRTAAKAGFKCTNFYRETWASTEWDGPRLGMRPGMCTYNGNPSWKASCARRPACGYGHRLCPCVDRQVSLRR